MSIRRNFQGPPRGTGFNQQPIHSSCSQTHLALHGGRPVRGARCGLSRSTSCSIWFKIISQTFHDSAPARWLSAGTGTQHSDSTQERPGSVPLKTHQSIRNGTLVDVMHSIRGTGKESVNGHLYHVGQATRYGWNGQARFLIICEPVFSLWVNLMRYKKY